MWLAPETAAPLAAALPRAAVTSSKGDLGDVCSCSAKHRSPPATPYAVAENACGPDSQVLPAADKPEGLSGRYGRQTELKTNTACVGIHPSAHMTDTSESYLSGMQFTWMEANKNALLSAGM
jgi:hypothetical protein